MVQSNLLGRYVSGHWRIPNPKHVYQSDRKKGKDYPPEADDYWIWYDVIERIVAITQEKNDDERLIFWVLVDGTPKRLCPSTARVMPIDWTPSLR